MKDLKGKFHSASIILLTIGFAAMVVGVFFKAVFGLDTLFNIGLITTIFCGVLTAFLEEE